MLRDTARFLQRLLFAIGFLVLGYVGADWLNSRIQQTRGNQELDRLLSQNEPSKKAMNGQAPNTRVPDGALVGRVEIPKLHLSAVVFQGTTSSILDKGVGHVDSTALPGQAGNVVLAAHRDSFFRELRNIHQGDDVTVMTTSGQRTYKVASTEIVDPTEVSVLNATAKPTLTLITCYPFYYVGHAPKRFIVRALEENPVLKLAPQLSAKKETAEEMAALEPVSRQASDPDRHQTPAEIENLTYVFTASQ
jgi:sortase A